MIDLHHLGPVSEIDRTAGNRIRRDSEAPLNADRHSVAAIRSAARPDGRVLAPAVRGTGLPARNKRRPCQIEGSAAATTNILKRKADSLTLARGWPLASHSLRQQKEGNRPIEREVAGTIKQVFALKCVGFLLKCRTKCIRFCTYPRMPLPTLHLTPHGVRRTARGESGGYLSFLRDFHSLHLHQLA